MIDNVRNSWKDWKVIKELGEGSYGKVYEIERTQHGITERDALKIIRIPKNHQQYEELAYRMTDDDEEAINAMFAEQKDKVINEIRAMQQLKSSDNIVSIKDWGVEKLEDGYSWEIYIRMDVLTPLIQYVKGRTPSEDEVIRLGEDICRALIRCEEENIVHRDIKPDNIMVSEEGKFMLTDFGIARYLTDETTMTGIGSKPYMAPEIANYQKSNKTVDLYSLGLVMYELLNNFRPPFVNANGKYGALDKEAAIQRRMRGEKLPMPFRGSEDLKLFVLMASYPDPSKRFESASAMLNALRNIKRDKKTPKPEEGFQGGTPTEIFTENQNKTQNVIKPNNIPEAERVPVQGVQPVEGGHVTAPPPLVNPTVNNNGRGNGTKKFLIAGGCSLLTIALICLLAFSGLFKDDPKRDIEKIYEKFKETAEDCGWEVEELSFIDANDAYSSAEKTSANEEYYSVMVTFYGDWDEFNKRVESETKDPPDSVTVINSELTSHMSGGDEFLTALKDRMELTVISTSAGEREEALKLYEELGINTEGAEDIVIKEPEAEEEIEEVVEEGVITDISGNFLDKEKNAKFGEWDCAVYELDTKLSSPEWITVGVSLSNVEGDVAGDYEIKYRSEGKWGTLGTINVEMSYLQYTDTFNVPLGKSVEALSLVPKTVHPQTFSVSYYIEKAKSRFIEGHVYTLQDDLNVRSTPEVKKGNILKRGDLPSDFYAMSLDKTGDAVLKKGSKVVCNGMEGRWMKIDPGYVCVFDKEPLIAP